MKKEKGITLIAMVDTIIIATVGNLTVHPIVCLLASSIEVNGKGDNITLNYK